MARARPYFEVYVLVHTSRSDPQEGAEGTPELARDVGEALKGNGSLLPLVQLLDRNPQDGLRGQGGGEGGQQQIRTDGGLGRGQLMGVQGALTGFENQLNGMITNDKFCCTRWGQQSVICLSPFSFFSLFLDGICRAQ